MKKFAVIGNPIEHSRSPQLHQSFAKDAGIEIEYQKIPAPLDQFPETAKRFFANGGDALNITVPFKEQAYELADELTPKAQAAKAVNLLVKQGDKLLGENTDGVGLVRDIEKNLHCPLKGKNVLLLGAGGAIKGVLPSILEKQPYAITIANRTLSKAQALAQQYQLNTSTLEALHQPFDIIINGTSCSLLKIPLALPTVIIDKNTFCYDMLYADEPSLFMRWCLDQAATQVHDGEGMLYEQGVAAFAVMTNKN